MIKSLSRLLAPSRPEPVQLAERIAAVQLHIILPAKIGVAAIALYYLYSGWFSETPSIYLLVIDVLQKYFSIYILCNLAGGVVFFLWRRLPPGLMQWLVFTLGLLDGLFMGGLTFITGGFESIAYWIFLGLIVLNAISIPLATPQIVLNLLLSLFYLSAGILAINVPVPELWLPPAKVLHLSEATHGETHLGSTNAPPIKGSSPRNLRPLQIGELPYGATSEDTSGESPAESLYPRLLLLWLLTACCYGVQLLVARQRETVEEAREFAVREGQLRSASRLAAEFAHQIKNPLAVINNTAFSLQRSLRDGKADAARQIEIIQEEVARADRVITQITGYAQLSEGRVEKLNVLAELDRAVAQVFPPAVPTQIKIHRQYTEHFPPLLMLRGHLSEMLVNLLKNAREALGDKGNIFVTADCLHDYSTEISIRDDGPGIPPDKIERIFEAYYTTKEKGTGLGLAIVKHNVELYGGAIRVESGVGKGARFVLTFPAKTILGLRK